MKTPRRNASAYAAVLFLLLGLALGAYGVYRELPRYRATHHRPVAPSSRVITTSTSNPDETAIDTHSVPYNVPADMPKLISIPSAGAQGYVQQVATDHTTNQLAVPTNIHFAGWYTGSVKPGEAGLSIIDGHITGRYAPGLFQNLRSVRPGDAVTVAFGDDYMKQFKVVSVHEYQLQEVMAALLHHDPTIESQLNLITCGGDYDTSKGTFNKRVVVVTKLVH